LPDGTLQENAFPTSLLAGFVDVAIDPTDEAKVFALSSFDGQACSFKLQDSNALFLVNCVGDCVGDDITTGISAGGGMMIVSAGTEGCQN
jgi:hypothetical protein